MADTKLGTGTAGALRIIPVNHKGPASYTTGGETLGTTPPPAGGTIAGLSSLMMVLGSGSLAVSGNYWVVVQPTGAGNHATQKLLWFTASSGVPSLTQVTAATNLSGETVVLGYVG
jgi:hypothetical protein